MPPRQPRFGSQILENVLRDIAAQRDATRVHAAQRPAHVANASMLEQLFPHASVMPAEALAMWAERALYDAYRRAMSTGDEFHKGPYPTDLPAPADTRWLDATDPAWVGPREWAQPRAKKRDSR
jgi:hypothetical protein